MTRGCLTCIVLFITSWTGCALTKPCWFPSQGNEVIMGDAEASLLSVLDAEDRYYANHQRYARLSELGADNLISPDLAHGTSWRYYNVNVEQADPNSFVVTLEPKEKDNSLVCILGCARPSFYADNTRIVHISRHGSATIKGERPDGTGLNPNPETRKIGTNYRWLNSVGQRGRSIVHFWQLAKRGRALLPRNSTSAGESASSGEQLVPKDRDAGTRDAGTGNVIT